MKQKLIFNTQSHEPYDQARILNGNPNGIINFNKTNHKFAREIYKNMQARTWFPQQVNVTKDKVNYTKLSVEEKRAYDLVLAQLITNDSIQTNQLADKINSYVTSPVVNAALVKQAQEECVIEGTEVFTPKGWVKIEKISAKDLILASDENQESYFTKVKRMVKRDLNTDEQIYTIKGDNFIQKVTGNHRVPVLKDDKIVVYTAEELFNKYKNEDVGEIILSIGKNKPVKNEYLKGNKFLKLQLELIKKIKIYGKEFKRDYFRFEENMDIDPFVKWLKKNKIDYVVESLSNKQTDKIRYTGFIYNGYNMFDKKSELDYYNFIGLDYLINNKYDVNAIAKILLNNDIEITPENNDKIAEVYAEIISYVIDLLFLNNETVKDMTADLEPDSDDKTMIISFNSLDLTSKSYATSKIKSITRRKSTKKVYCPTVKGGLFYMRYDNKISLTGNCNHSDSYSVIAEDICQDTDRIFNLQYEDEELAIKNASVEKMYMSLYKGDDPTVEDLLKCFAANQILEELVFPGGFAVLLSITSMIGTVEMIAEING